MHCSRDRSPCNPAYCRVCKSPTPSYQRAYCACKQGYLCPSPVKSVRFQDPRGNFPRTTSTCRASFYPGGHRTYRDVSPSAPEVFRDNLSTLLRKLSILQLEMNGLTRSRSLKDRVQFLRQKLDNEMLLNASHDPCHTRKVFDSISVKDTCEGVSENRQDTSACRCKVVDSKTPERSPLKQFDCDEHEKREEGKIDGVSHVCFGERREEQSRDGKKIAKLWEEYNCDLHLPRIIDNSRKKAALKILEKVVHTRLTSYMLQYIAGVAKGLIGDDKTHYLRFFKREGPFRNKPLNVGTYGELLHFVDTQVKLAKDVVKALEVAEEGLEEAGAKEGLHPSAIGDIRSQMRVFLDVIAAPSAVSSPVPGATPFNAFTRDEADYDLFSMELLEDLIHAAGAGKLGNLQNAYKLVKMACFLALKSIKMPE